MSWLRRICLLAVLSISSIAMMAAKPAVQGPVKDNDPIVRDAEVYAADLGIGLQEAMRRLSLQIPAGKLSANLAANETNTFAGLWIQHAPDFRIIVLLTDGNYESIRKYVDGGPLTGLVDVRVAKLSLAELEAVQNAVHQTVAALGIPCNSRTNVFQNRVELHITDPIRLETALASASLGLPDSVKVVTVSELIQEAEDYLLGGKPLTTCTSGYSVVNGSGVRGITTAGHCSNNQTYLEYGLNLPQPAGEIDLGPYDIQWHSAPVGYIPTNMIWDGTQNRPIYSIKVRDDQALNEFVCKYGMTTGYGCGLIVSKSVRPASDHDNTFIQLHNSDNLDLAEPGDSGGPVFYGSIAYGTIAYEWDKDMLYMAVNYVEQGLGVTVLR